jgi:hypothetical protein
MYFDSWSASYFFWVIICFAVWGIAGFSVYGVFNIFAAKRKRAGREDGKPLSLEKIREIKLKAEREAAERAYQGSCEVNAEEQLLREAVSLISAEDNSTDPPENFEESTEDVFLANAEEIAVENSVDGGASQINIDKDPEEEEKEAEEERSEKLSRKLEEIYQRERLSVEKNDIAEDNESGLPEENIPCPDRLEKNEDDMEAPAASCARRTGGWKELDDIYRNAFRGRS